MKPHAKSAASSVRYRQFVSDRDKALEKLHRKYQVMTSDHLTGFLSKCLDIAAHRYLHISPGDYFMRGAKGSVASIDQAIQDEQFVTAHTIAHDFLTLRKATTVIAYASEIEAIRRTLGDEPKEMRAHNYKKAIDASQRKEAPGGGQLVPRIELALSRIRRRIMDAIEMSRVTEEPVHAMLARVKKTFPKLQTFKKAPRVLKQVKEADVFPKSGSGISFKFVDDDTWGDVVADYVKDYVPQYRGPDYAFEPDEIPGAAAYSIATGGEATDQWYGWEIEQELTQDFVQNVRDGQIVAAKENGINDFQWIAILDSKTDECCAWRDGLTVSEIEALLKTEHSDDECDTPVPPAHFNCRCTLAPMLDDMPEVEPSNQGEFDEWLNS